MLNGKIHKLESLATLDGPGIRFLIFMQGCPLNCAYCHNPDSQAFENYTITKTPSELLEHLLHYKNYIKNGGVTVSGGEPLCQSEFVYEFFKLCKQHNIHTALDTSGCLLNDSVKKLLEVSDLILLDLKMNTQELYKKYIGCDLNQTLDFLAYLLSIKKDVWIRQVIVPNINDLPDDIKNLADLIKPYLSIVKKVELLPFKKLCLEKYAKLGRTFPLNDTPEMDIEQNKLLNKQINTLLNLPK